MALSWSAALNPTQISRQHGTQYGFCKLRQEGSRPKQEVRMVVYASTGETVEDKSTEPSKDEEQKVDEAAATKPTMATSASPFVGAKISSRIAARAGDTASARGMASTTQPTIPKSSKTQGPQGLPPFNLNTPRSQSNSTFSPKPGSSQTFSPKPPSPFNAKPPSSQGSPKPASSQTFSPKPPSPFNAKSPSSQGSPFSSPLAGTEKLKEAKRSVFLDSRAGGAYKEAGPKGLLSTLRGSEGKTTRFGQPGVPTNLFDEPEKLTAEDKKRFDFTLNAGQLVLVFSFLTIIGIMLGTSFLVWKVGAIHYNEF